MDFYSEKKWCGKCQSYVRYLMNVHHSYCVECGSVVHLFSKEDWDKFNAKLQNAPAKNTRRRTDRRVS